MSKIAARVICDSIAEHSPRLTSFATTFHQFVLAERNTHRVFSRSDRSTRAVSFQRLKNEVLEDPAMPVTFLHAKKGMGGGEPMTGKDLEQAQKRWKADSVSALVRASEAEEAGEARESVNARILPYIYTHSIITSCESGLLNFFGLRLDKSARPEIRTLAEVMWAAWNESKPRRLNRYEWHLPLIEEETWDKLWPIPDIMDEKATIIKISASRCARQSFSYGVTHTVEEDLKLYSRLVNNIPMHLGPLEHQATPDEWESTVGTYEYGWIHSYLHGNLPGWIQFRQTIPGQACAPLPEGYSR